MKCLNVGLNAHPSSGGTFRTISYFSAALRQGGLDPVVLNFSRRPKDSTVSDARTFSTSQLPLLAHYHWSGSLYSKDIDQVVADTDIIFVHGLYFHAAARIARLAKLREIPVILVPHGGLDPFVFTYRKWRKLAWLSLHRRILIEGSACVLFSSELERRKAAELVGSVACRVINWPTDYVEESEKNGALYHIQKRHLLPPMTRIALFCGRISSIKRPLELINAFARLANSDWVLLVVGPVSDDIGAEKMRAACAKARGKCVHVGPVFGEELRDYYRAADIFVLVSKKENFCYAVAEAAACGVPVVISKEMDVWPYVEQSGAGFVLDDCSDAGLRESLSAILAKDCVELTSVGRNGRQWARQALNFRLFADRLTGLVNEVVEMHKRNGR